METSISRQLRKQVGKWPGVKHAIPPPRPLYTSTWRMPSCSKEKPARSVRLFTALKTLTTDGAVESMKMHKGPSADIRGKSTQLRIPAVGENARGSIGVKFSLTTSIWGPNCLSAPFLRVRRHGGALKLTLALAAKLGIWGRYRIEKVHFPGAEYRSRMGFAGEI